MSRRGRKHAISPPRSPHLDHIINPPLNRKTRVLNFSAGPEVDRPNNVSLITRSKSNVGYAAAFLSKSHDDEVKRNRFKFKSGSTKKNRPHLVSEHYPRKKSWVAADAVKKFFLQKANPLYRENVQMTAEGTNKEQEYRKLVQALHAMAASDKYFGKPQPPLGGYHWFMRVVERSDWESGGAPYAIIRKTPW